MLGYSHAISGALSWVATAPLLLNEVFHIEPNLGLYLSGAIVTAGAAMLPDVDHPQATIANTYGFITKNIATFFEKISGGHRNGTHSLLFAVLAGALTQLVVLLNVPILTALIVFIFTSFFLKSFNIIPLVGGKELRPIILAVTAGGTTWALFTLANINSWVWLGSAVFLGCIVHCIGDALTPQKVPLLWPSKYRYGIPLIPKTGDSVERYMVVPLMVIALAYVSWKNVGVPYL